MKNYLELGAWNAICDRCGYKHKNHQLRKEWTGLMVCSKCFEARHPQDLLKPPHESAPIPWMRPEPVDTYISDYIQTEESPLPQDILTEIGMPLVTET